jgi:hypothetical protein
MGDGVAALEPCSGCGRHVRVSESACPFCGTSLDFSNVPAQLYPTERLSRAAMMSFRNLVAAGVVGATTAVSACELPTATAMYGAPCTDDCQPQGGTAGTAGVAGSGASPSGGSGGRGGSGGQSGSATTGGNAGNGNSGGAAGSGAGAGGSGGGGGSGGSDGGAGAGGEGGFGEGGQGGEGGG